MKEKLKQVRILTVHHHSSYWCRPDKFPSIFLPNLITLDIQVDEEFYNHFHDRTRTPAPTSNSSCPLLLELKPKNLILRIHGFERVIYGYGGIPLGIFDKVDSVFLIPRVGIGYMAYFDPYEGLSRSPPSRIKSITIIYKVIPDYTSSAQESMKQRRKGNRYAKLQKMVEDLGDSEISLIIVLQRYLSEGVEEEMQQAINIHLDGLPEKFWSQEKKEKRKKMVGVLSLQRWVAERWRWEDRFDEDEVWGWEDEGGIL
ncbi:hypothetical protein I203_107240 [Kwoniella mangroviensis CBS 8507]|uniref:hypothetical protein n=1 Tax=Kwoniella mangroviensis CBS 8507 TaxID=1296122 RepID=UPI00080D0AF1|nr:uncharacterized protein I203_01989 [Kwoniella mangroviensis CBS 8507]OCF68606.1 hypothetical protein I203_01989 [Kwoniella mangroviensis CBS 8507]